MTNNRKLRNQRRRAIKKNRDELLEEHSYWMWVNRAVK